MAPRRPLDRGRCTSAARRSTEKAASPAGPHTPQSKHGAFQRPCAFLSDAHRSYITLRGPMRGEAAGSARGTPQLRETRCALDSHRTRAPHRAASRARLRRPALSPAPAMRVTVCMGPIAVRLHPKTARGAPTPHSTPWRGPPKHAMSRGNIAKRGGTSRGVHRAPFSAPPRPQHRSGGVFIPWDPTPAAPAAGGGRRGRQRRPVARGGTLLRSSSAGGASLEAPAVAPPAAPW